MNVVWSPPLLLAVLAAGTILTLPPQVQNELEWQLGGSVDDPYTPPRLGLLKKHLQEEYQGAHRVPAQLWSVDGVLAEIAAAYDAAWDREYVARRKAARSKATELIDVVGADEATQRKLFLVADGAAAESIRWQRLTAEDIVRRAIKCVREAGGGKQLALRVGSEYESYFASNCDWGERDRRSWRRRLRKVLSPQQSRTLAARERERIDALKQHLVDHAVLTLDWELRLSSERLARVRRVLQEQATRLDDRVVTEYDVWWPGSQEVSLGEWMRWNVDLVYQSPQLREVLTPEQWRRFRDEFGESDWWIAEVVSECVLGVWEQVLDAFPIHEGAVMNRDPFAESESEDR